MCNHDAVGKRHDKHVAQCHDPGAAAVHLVRLLKGGFGAWSSSVSRWGRKGSSWQFHELAGFGML